MQEIDKEQAIVLASQEEVEQFHFLYVTEMDQGQLRLPVKYDSYPPEEGPKRQALMTVYDSMFAWRAPEMPGWEEAFSLAFCDEFVSRGYFRGTTPIIMQSEDWGGGLEAALKAASEREEPIFHATGVHHFGEDGYMYSGREIESLLDHHVAGYLQLHDAVKKGLYKPKLKDTERSILDAMQ